MADNVNVTPGSGKIIAAEDIGSGVLVQRVKMVLGVLDTDSGDVSSGNPMPISATSLPLPTLAATSTKQSDGTQKTQLVDGAGLVIGPAIVSGGENSLPVAQSATNFVFSTVNSSAVQLAASATFTGVVESAVSQQSYSILVASDQPGTLNILQYIDAGGTKLIQTVTITHLANVPIARSGVINGNYIKVTYQNTGASTTTTFQLDTAYGTIPASTQLNNFPMSLSEVNGTAISLGQTTMAASLPVVIASNQASIPVAATLSAETTKVIGTVNVAAAQTIAVTQATAANLNATVTPIALTKGTQGATGFSVQALNDAGRNITNFFMAIQIVTTATDALLSLTGYKSGAAVGATTTPAVVTSGKTYRITSATISYTTIVTTPGSVRFTLRANTGGVVAIGSPAVCNWEVGEPTGIAPVAGKKNTVHLTFSDGIEFAAGTGIGVSQVGLNTVGAAAVVGYGQITLCGYEY